MRKKIRSARCQEKQSKTIAVGELQTAQTIHQTLPDRPDSAPENSEVLRPENHAGTCRIARAARSFARGCGYSAVKILTLFIRIYQKTVAPLLPECCRFQPTCSHYAVEALQKHGFCKGSLLMIWRLARCQPFCKGGYDPVPDEFYLTPMRRNKQDLDK